MKKVILIAIAVALICAAAASADVITQYAYQYGASTDSTNTYATNNATTGSGTSGSFGGVTLAPASGPFPAGYYSDGNAGTGTAASTDPSAYGEALGLVDFTQGTAGQRGVCWVTSVAGYSNIQIGWDWRMTATGPRDWLLQYTTNYVDPINSTWVDVSDMAYPSASASLWANGNLVSLDSGANNASNFAFRLVNTSTTAVNGGAIGSTGTFRIDMVTVTGSAVPEPGSLLGLAGGLFGALGFVIRRKRS